MLAPPQKYVNYILTLLIEILRGRKEKMSLKRYLFCKVMIIGATETGFVVSLLRLRS